MYTQIEFNVRPSNWATIAKPIEGKNGKMRSRKNVELEVRVEPYVGNSQATLEWQTVEIPLPEIRQAVLQGIKETAKTNGKKFPYEFAPLINFRVIVTKFKPLVANVATYEAKDVAADAFSDALQQADVIPLDKAANTGYWESIDEQTKTNPEFQILPIATSTLGISGETRFVYRRQSSPPERFAIIRLLLEPYQGATDYWCGSDVPPSECPTEFIQASFKGIREAALFDFLGHGVLINIRATVLETRIHLVDSSETSFKIAGALAFSEILAKTPIVNLL
jgi:hypothetical protein